MGSYDTSTPRNPATRRRIPKWGELGPFVALSKPTLNRTSRDLSRALTIADLRSVAARRVPRSVFDYTDGAAESEVALTRARQTFRDLEFRPSILKDVGEVDTSVTILGRQSALPFAFAPTGFTRLMHHEGESAVARVAARHGIPYALSTMGTTSIEMTANAARANDEHSRLWFQLYVWKDRGATAELVSRARNAGYEALMLTVDVPVAGARLRDVRNGFSLPPSLTARTLLDIARHPSWWMNLVTTDPLEFASLTQWGGTVSELLDTIFDPTMTISDLEWLREIWDGPLIIKGVQTLKDVVRVVEAGVDAVVISNHGGRQLDRTPAPVRLVREAVDTVGGRSEIWVDTGITNGGDIVACLALGARTVLVGRAYLYGLMAGGERGVDRAVEILEDEVIRTLKLLGVKSVMELHPDHVHLSDRKPA